MEEKKNVIAEYYAGLSRKEKAAFQLEACKVCDISLHMFLRRNRLNLWSRLEREAVGRLIPENYLRGE